MSLGKRLINSSDSGGAGGGEDGKYMIISNGAGRTAARSSDGGATWTSTNVGVNVFGTAISGTGQYQYFTASNDGIYRSNDYGATFTKTSVVKNWLDVATDHTGQYVIACDYAQVFRSTDYGASFSLVIASVTNGRLCFSGNGQYAYHIAETGSVKRSANGGASWSSISVGSGARKGDVSYDGKYVRIAYWNSNSVFALSTNYGVSFPTTSSSYGMDVALNNSGQFQFQKGFSAVSYYSTDFGATNNSLPFSTTVSCAYNGSGSKLIQGNDRAPYLLLSEDNGVTSTGLTVPITGQITSVSLNKLYTP